MTLDEVVIRELARRRGMDEKRVKEILESLKRDEDYSEKVKKFLTLLGTATETIEKLPENMQSAIAPVITQSMYPLIGGGDELTKVAEKAAVIRAILDTDGSRARELEAKVDELYKEFRSWKESLSESEKQQLYDTINKLNERIEELQARIDELKNRGTGTESPTEIMARAKEEVSKIITTLKELGFKVEKAETKSIEEQIKELENMGYRVERKYIAPEELEKIKEEMKENVRKDLERELEIEKTKIETVGGIIRDIVKEVVSRFADAWSEAQKEAVREMIRQRRQLAMRIKGVESEGERGKTGSGESGKKQQTST